MAELYAEMYAEGYNPSRGLGPVFALMAISSVVAIACFFVFFIVMSPATRYRSADMARRVLAGYV